MNWNEIWPQFRPASRKKATCSSFNASVNMYTMDILFLTSCSCTLSFVAEFKKVKTATSDLICNSSHPLSFFFQHVALQRKWKKMIQQTDEDNSSSWKLFSEFLLGTTSNSKAMFPFCPKPPLLIKYCKPGGAGRLQFYKTQILLLRGASWGHL